MSDTATMNQEVVEETRSGSLINSLKNFGHILLAIIIMIYNSIIHIVNCGPQKEHAVEMTEISAGRESPVSERKDAPIASAPSSLSNAQKDDQSFNSTQASGKQDEREASAPENVGGVFPEPAADQTKNTIVIKNLPFKFKQTELDALLSEHGAKPKNVRMMRDNSSRFTGIAFIRCNSKDEAGRLIVSMNNLDIGGRNIQVDFKQKKRKGKLNSSCDMGATSSDSEMSQPPSLRSSGEFIREALEDKESRARLRMSAEHRDSPISLEHLNTAAVGHAPIPPVLVYQPFSNSDSSVYAFPPSQQQQQQVAPPNMHRRYSLNHIPQQMVSAAQSGNSSYFHYPHFNGQNKTPTKKMDIRRSTQCVSENRNENNGSNHGPVPFERRRSIAGMDESLRQNYSRTNSVIRPPSVVVRSGIAPIRQPNGPDGKTNGFSQEYQASRTLVH